MTVSVVFAIAGVIALLFGVIGGGIKAKEVEVPRLSTNVRIFTIIVGLALIGTTVWIENKNKTDTSFTPTLTPMLPSTLSQTTDLSDETLLSVATNWRSIVFNDFKDDSGGWWTGNDGDGNFKVASGKYVWTYPPNTSHTWWRWRQVPLDSKFYLAVDVNLASGPKDSQYSLMFRRVGINHYLFTVKNDGYFRIIYYLDDVYYPIKDWTASPEIRDGATNRLAVIADDSHYWFAINNVIVADISDDRLAGGIAGLHFSSDTGESPAIIEFDNYELREP